MKNLSVKYFLSEIWIYPVKSLSGIRLTEANAQERGLEFDRRWMIVDGNNHFLSQRQIPEMVLIQPELGIENGVLNFIKFFNKLDKTNSFLLKNPATPKVAQKGFEVTVWDDTIMAFEINDAINNWLSMILNIRCKLVYMTESVIRKVDPKYAQSGNEITSFADGYPYLVAGSSALDLLNSKLIEPIEILRFRPNFVFSGGDAHDEDNWNRLHIGEASFIGVKNCARCPIPTIDTAIATKSKEPIKTLASYRTRNNKVYFGQNMLIEKLGKIKVGDVISVISKIV